MGTLKNSYAPPSMAALRLISLQKTVFSIWFKLDI
jgi:hypothetical protein